MSENAKEVIKDTFRMAGARLTENIDPELASAFYPGPMEKVKDAFTAVHQFDKAHTVMLTEEGIIPIQDAAKILYGLLNLEKEDVVKTRVASGGSYHSGELLLSQRIGADVAGKIHFGRSSSDLSAVAHRMTLKAKLLYVFAALDELREATIDKASQHIGTVMPHYSHLQHGQVTTFAHYMLSWTSVFERDFSRLLDAYTRADHSAAGAAIGTGSAYPINQQRTAQLLGFPDVYHNTRDAIFNHDFFLEAFCALTLLLSNLGRLADDLHLWASKEFGMVNIADRYCITSSIMPQKKNPWGTQYVRGMSGKALGRLAGVFAVAKTLSDQIEIEDYLPMEAWEFISDVLSCLHITTGIVETLTTNEDVMIERASQFWNTATDMAAFIAAKRNMPWRTAHRIVSILMRKVDGAGITPKDLTGEMVDEVARDVLGEPLRLTTEALQESLSVRRFVAARKLTGGPAPEEMRQQLQYHKEVLWHDKKALDRLSAVIEAAENELKQAINTILQQADEQA
jgi:argininosuccinate lyase